MSKTTTKLMVAVIGLFVALALTATTTFAWFTMSKQPKVAQFDLTATTRDADLLISMKYSDVDGGKWSPFLPNVSSEYMGNDDTGIFGTGNIAENLTLNHASLINSGSIETDGNGLVLRGGYDSNSTVLTANGADGYLKLTFRFQSTTQYLVGLNTDKIKSTDTITNLASAKNFVQPKGEQTTATQTIRAWDNTITEANYGKNIAAGQLLDARAAYAARVGFVSNAMSEFDSCAESAFDANTIYYKKDASYNYVSQGKIEEATFNAEKNNLYTTQAVDDAVIWNPNIAEGFKGNEATHDSVAANNLAYQYAKQDYIQKNGGTAAEYGFTTAGQGYLDGSINNIDTARNHNLVTLTDENEDGIYEGTLDVYIWLEGWDGDCFNNILGDKMEVSLTFKGTRV